MSALRRRFVVFLVAITGCAAPLTLAEPRGDGGVAQDGSGADAEPDVPSFGERPDVAMGDELVSIQSEGGLEDAGDASDGSID